MTKVFVITAKTEFELVKKMNESKIAYFASQPTQKNNGEWCCFLYYRDIPLKRIMSSQAITERKSTTSVPATSKQIHFLKQIDYEGDLKKITKQEAFQLIKEYKESLL